MGPVEDFIDQILVEDQQAPRKQRHTPIAFGHGSARAKPDHPNCEPTVRQYVRKRKREMGVNAAKYLFRDPTCWDRKRKSTGSKPPLD